jgi:hypothetical protein
MPRRAWLWLWFVLSATHAVATAQGFSEVGGDTPPAARRDAGEVVLHIRAYADGEVAPNALIRAHDVANGILEAAGLFAEWRLCDLSETCPPERGDSSEVVVILSSRPRPDGRLDCGRAARGAHISEGTVIVSVPCVRDVVRQLARPSRNRSHPVLASARHEDLVGAAVAHEIGHVLGMGHTPTGLMRAQLGADEVIALGLGRLGFGEPEAALLRARATLARRE